MKKNLLSISFLLITGYAAVAQWVSIPSGTSSKRYLFYKMHK